MTSMASNIWSTLEVIMLLNIIIEKDQVVLFVQYRSFGSEFDVELDRLLAREFVKTNEGWDIKNVIIDSHGKYEDAQ